jgi:hypothetical protein
LEDVEDVLLLEADVLDDVFDDVNAMVYIVNYIKFYVCVPTIVQVGAVKEATVHIFNFPLTAIKSPTSPTVRSAVYVGTFNRELKREYLLKS